QPSLNAPNGVSTSANTGSAQISTPANPAVGSGLPIGAPVSGTTLSFAATDTPAPGSFVTLGSSLTANLGGNLSGPSTVPPFATGPEPSPAEHHNRPANTSGARPGAGEALTIDWSGTGALDQLDSSKDSHDSQDWVEDFLNHLG